MAKNTIECNNCQKNVVPRLWHIRGGMTTNDSTQHICPFCGVVMYTTGGETTSFGKAIGNVFVFLFFYTLFMTIVTFLREFGSAGTYLAVAVFIYGHYLLIIKPICKFLFKNRNISNQAKLI